MFPMKCHTTHHTLHSVLTIRLEAGVQRVSQDDDPQATSHHEVVQAHKNHHTRYIPARTVELMSVTLAD